MRTYEAWNQAIIDYTVEGLPVGSMVFLSIDEEMLIQIGAQLGLASSETVADFCHAVYSKVVTEQRGQMDVSVKHLIGEDEAGKPSGVAFLALMVYAAYHMVEDNDATQTAYFLRFRTALKMPAAGGRPPGMHPGEAAEELLWKNWNRWLRKQSLLPSARAGAGKQRFIDYPISQTILRRADKGWLREWLQAKKRFKDCDAETLLTQIQREFRYFPTHLRELLKSGGQRYRAVIDSIYEFYQYWRSSPTTSVTVGSVRNSLFAGLFREEDTFTGSIRYFLYPRQNRRLRMEQVSVRTNDVLHTFVADGRGFYQHGIPLGLKEIANGARYPVEQSTALEELILPKRAFHVLVPDPYNVSGTSDYASWSDSPAPGVPFMLLCTADLLEPLEKLREARLLQWDKKVCPWPDVRDWIELQQCMILAEDWGHNSQIRLLANQDLYDKLRPKQRLSVSVSGGLRTNRFDMWLEGCGPNITVYGSLTEVEVRVVRLNDGCILHRSNHTPRTAFTLSADTWQPGRYRIAAGLEDETEERFVQIVAWTDLCRTRQQESFTTQIGMIRLFGAWIETAE